MDKVKVTSQGVECPVHGVVQNAEYKSQTPAPCGCDWVWEVEYDNRDQRVVLIAVPHFDWELIPTPAPRPDWDFDN